jgi:hypothetical protein
VKKLPIVLAMVLVLILSIAPVAAQPTDLQVPESALPDKEATYIVRMIQAPVLAYEGGIAGLPATKPGKGQKINPNSANVRKYVNYLNSQHDQALATAGAQGKKLYDYSITYNGFAARLTGAQAEKLLTLTSVLTVESDWMAKIDTNRTPTFLGLDAANGIWNAVGGVGDAGEGVVVGIVDTGIWPENPSFSDRTGTNPNGKGGKLDYKQIPGWHGKCTPGEQFNASNCNQKLIAAQWYNAGWGGNAGVKSEFPNEYASARDADGHGSHTASTAAGNYGIPVVVDGVDLGKISGVAPRARVAAYKVCWGGDAGGCFGSDSVAAIDQAVADGVDVINFSIGGSTTNYLDAVEVAFLFAADAGVFVATSAGNEGPGAGTVAHIAPWLASVAAGTKDETFPGSVTLGNGATYEGQARSGGIGPAELVLAATAGDKLCNPGALDPALVTGKIVVCERGVIGRTEKSLAVKQAGGVGMIMYNATPSSVNADLHFVPSIHVDHIAGPAIVAYAATPGATATIVAGDATLIDAPDVAEFSSRGPNQAGGDILKPDMMAPGVDILAAVSPTGYNGRNFDFLSGTSMASPHVAGFAALLTDAHPEWSPAAMKSAMMTTATPLTKEGNPIDGTAFDYGAGHIVPNDATDPGLVYDAGFLDYFGFLCGTGQLVSPDCAALSIDPSDLNHPSISIGELAGAQTVTRTVTNVGPSGTYTVSVDAPPGVDVAVNPSSLTLASGQSATYEVTFTVTTAPIDEYTFGALTWSDGTRSVRSPLVVQPVQIAAPAEVSAAGTDGSLSFDVTFGYTGDYAATAHGLIPATQTAGNVVDDPANDINVALDTGVGISVHVVPVPAGTLHARFSLFDDFTDGTDDLDLYVFNPSGQFAGGSGSGTSAEQVDIAAPAAGNWFVVVHGWQTDGPDANYTLFSWRVPSATGGSLSVDSAPASATLGETGTIEVSWSGLTAGTKYLGAVSHSDGGGIFAVTLVGVTTD